MYIVKAGILYLKSIGETDKDGNTNIQLGMDQSIAMQFDTAEAAQDVIDRYNITDLNDVKGEAVEA